MAAPSNGSEIKLKCLAQVLNVDSSFAPHRPRLRTQDDEETLYVKWRKILLYRQMKANRIMAGIEGDRRADYLFAREQLLSARFPARDRTRKAIDANSSRTGSRTGSRLDSNDEAERKSSTTALKMKAAEWYNFRGMHHIMAYHQQAVTRIKFAQDDRGLFAMASEDGTISLVDAMSTRGIDETKLVLKGHKAEITDFCFSVENDFIVSSSMDKSIMVWDTKTGKFVRGFEDPDPITCVMFHPINDHLLIYGNARGEVKFVSFSNGSQVAYFKVNHPVTALAFDESQATTMYVGDAGGELTFLSVKYSAQEYHLESTGLARLNRSPIHSISWRNQHTTSWSLPTLLISQADQSVKLLACRKIDGKETVQELAKFPRPLKRSKIRSSYCPLTNRGDLPCIVVGSDSGTLFIYGYAKPQDDKRTSRVTLVNQLAGHSGSVLDVAWNADESLLASCDKDGIVIMWKRIDLK